MALHSSLPIYKAVYDLLCLVTEVTRNTPFSTPLRGVPREYCIGF
jgi:hypothetical protein